MSPVLAGAPFLVSLAAALMVYSVGRAVEQRAGTAIERRAGTAAHRGTA